ncbi:sensor histidine kinase [Desulfurispira natronophila]|uniref:histidine kinase n=1 Tax=Desulfurispira natronophila TaxID=682562 RepID=A0A7W8DFY6_9BACT|nr:sensor histidine kinase [Desulfurispira natronophila]MBB5020867.1 PAS domain S-box-containing protein [Desulfurispira natronophila]
MTCAKIEDNSDLVVASLKVDTTSSWHERYEQMLYSAGDGLWEWDFTTNQIFMSPRFKEIAGYEEHELPNTMAAWRSILHPSEQKRMIERLRGFSSIPGRQFQLVHRLLSRSGASKWSLLRGQILSDRHGTSTKAIAFLTDIDEQRKIEDELDQARTLLSDTQLRARMGNWELDLNSDALWWSDEMYRIFEIDPGEFDGTLNGFLSFVSLSERSDLKRLLYQAGSFASRVTVEVPGRNNKTISLEAQARHDQDGRPLRLVGLAQDITWERQAQQQMSKLIRALEHVPNSVAIANREGIIEYVNPFFSDFTGYHEDEVLGQQANILKSGKQDRDFYRHLWQTILEGKIFEGEMINRRKDGSLYLEQKSISPVWDERGQITHFVAIGRDITEQNRLKSEIEEANQALMKFNAELQQRVEEEIGKRRQQEQLVMQQARLSAMGEMMSYVAHHWRQPLNIIGLLVQSTRVAYDTGELDDEYLQDTSIRIMEQVWKMSDTINVFADFSQESHDKVRFDLVRAIGETFALIHHQFKELGVDIVGIQGPQKTPMVAINAPHCELPVKSSPYTVLGYPNEFKHVLLGIFNNARDAILNHFQHTSKTEASSQTLGTITVHADHTEECVLIEVFDNGGGIPTSIFPRIFDPYFTTKEVGRGTGISLYMAKTIIENHMSGTLNARNHGAGACFTIRLPLAQQEM